MFCEMQTRTESWIKTEHLFFSGWVKNYGLSVHLRGNTIKTETIISKLIEIE